MKPLILITNDDGVHARGIQALAAIAREFGDVVVMAPDRNASGKSHSLSTDHPLRANHIHSEEGLDVYSCDGTPVDCVKLAAEHFCSRKADLVLSGINHGSNASINVLYSGTMGAAIEASNNGYPAIGFSLLNHSIHADFSPCEPYIRQLIHFALEQGLPPYVSLNVNFPKLSAADIKGMRLCRESKAQWGDSFEKRIDPTGRAYYWLTGKFVCDDLEPDTDEWALRNGYVAIVPISPDFTCRNAIEPLKQGLGI